MTRRVSERAIIAARRFLTSIECDELEPLFAGDWGMVEHACHELGHLAYMGLNLSEERIDLIGQHDLYGEAVAWAISQSALVSLGCDTHTDQECIDGCGIQGVGVELWEEASNDARLNGWVNDVLGYLMHG